VASLLKMIGNTGEDLLALDRIGPGLLGCIGQFPSHRFRGHARPVLANRTFQLSVRLMMGLSGYGYQVLRSIVSPIAIYVMNKFSWLKSPSMRLFPNHAMLESIARVVRQMVSRHSEKPISIFRFLPSTFPAWAFLPNHISGVMAVNEAKRIAKIFLKSNASMVANRSSSPATAFAELRSGKPSWRIYFRLAHAQIIQGGIKNVNTSSHQRADRDGRL